MNLQHVAIIWVQVTKLRFLLLRLPRVLAQTPRALPILGHDGEEVEGAAHGSESGESKGEGVSPDILGGITSHNAEGSNWHGAVTEADLKGGTNAAPQVSTNF